MHLEAIQYFLLKGFRYETGSFGRLADVSRQRIVYSRHTIVGQPLQEFQHFSIYNLGTASLALKAHSVL